MARTTRLLRAFALTVCIGTTGLLALPLAAGAEGGATSYVVASGDTLVGIARSNGIALDALLQANGLTLTSLIVPGQELVIPEAAPVASGETYTVAAGDTLGGIANRLGVRLGALLTVNGMNANSLIVPGQELQLPTGASASASGNSSNGNGNASGNSTAAQGMQTGNSELDQVLNYALAQVGKPYVFFTKGASSFDCSGLTLAAYRQVGVDLVHHAATQANQGTAVDFWNSPIQAGDLVFLDGDWDGVIDHVGMALSSSTWIQASKTHDVVMTGPLPSDSVIIAVRRYI